MNYLILVRHGETATNTKRLLHNHGDSEELTEVGKSQLTKTAEKLRQFLPLIVYSSTEKRAIQSAEIIANVLGVELPTILPGIEERNWGIFAGENWGKVKKVLDPMKIEKRYTYTPQNGESWKTFETRLKKAINKVINENNNKSKVVITHGGAIRVLMPYLLNVDKEESFKYDPSNASITIFEIKQNEFNKVTIDDTTHLK